MKLMKEMVGIEAEMQKEREGRRVSVNEVEGVMNERTNEMKRNETKRNENEKTNRWTSFLS